MRHRKSGRKLNMSSSHRQAMFRNMVTSLLKHDRIRTTDARAKELRSWADHMITLAKRGDLHARRQALSIVREKDVVHKLFEEAEKRFGKMNGGYTRITKLGRRPGDAASVSIIELITAEEKPKKKKKKAKAAQKEAPVTAKTDEKVADTEKTASEEPSPAEGETAQAESAQEAAEADDAQAEEAPQAETAEKVEAKTEESADSDESGGADETSEQDTEKKED